MKNIERTFRPSTGWRSLVYAAVLSCSLQAVQAQDGNQIGAQKYPAAAGQGRTIKVVALLKAKAGLSRDEFIHYYETRHAPLARKLFPMISDYRRNFLGQEPRGNQQGAGPEFDVITEIWFPSAEAFEAFRRAGADPKVAEAIAADEANFLDRTKKRLYIVDERISPTPDSGTSESM